MTINELRLIRKEKAKVWFKTSFNLYKEYDENGNILYQHWNDGDWSEYYLDFYYFKFWKTRNEVEMYNIIINPSKIS